MIKYRDFNALLETQASGAAPETEAGLFGSPFNNEEANLVILGIPWDATCSYGRGSALTPKSISKVSHQLDLSDDFFGNTYRARISLDESLFEIAESNQSATEAAVKMREHATDETQLKTVNRLSAKVHKKIEERAVSILASGKIVGVLGGEHSCPYGLMKALTQNHDDFGVLHVDAHFDLRKAYEGITHSHASIFYNAINDLPQISSLVQVGIRDFSKDEWDFSQSNKRCHAFLASEMFRDQARGLSFAELATKIVQKLPQKIYVSFDIDGLDPSYCPNTGTPVPGGLSFAEACYLLEEICRQKKTVIGFDLCEAVPGDKSDWDLNVAARILYKLCGTVYKSQQEFFEARNKNA
ncbi:MAG: agmatinase [Oligoflexales bacterium]|nr:agmatinase [Oligoflexales bacterium]